MKTQITLEGKEIKQIIAHALEIPEEKVVPLRYNFAIEGYTESEVLKKLKSVGVK